MDTGRRRSRRGRLKTSGNNRAVTAIQTVHRPIVRVMRAPKDRRHGIAVVEVVKHQVRKLRALS